MDIELKKGKSGYTISCIRKDGSITWDRIPIGLELHDLAHYVIESEFELKQAFYGLIAAGYNINDFAKPKEERPLGVIPSNLSPEAQQAEHLVNILTIGYLQQQTVEEDLSMIRDVFSTHHLPAIKVDKHQWMNTRKRFLELIEQWKKDSVLVLKWDKG